MLLDRHGKLVGARVPATIALVSMRIGSCWVLRDLSDNWAEPNIWNLSGKSLSHVTATTVSGYLYTNGVLYRIFIRQQTATSLMVLVNMRWPLSSAR